MVLPRWWIRLDAGANQPGFLRHRGGRCVQREGNALTHC
jgi:hypothetical protein